MIYTITLNPAFDKTVVCEKFHENKLNKVINSREDIGGKGVNVSKVIKALGGESIAFGLLAEDRFDEYTDKLNAMGIGHYFIKLPRQKIRTNLKIIDQKSANLTELNEAGSFVSQNDVEKLSDHIFGELTAEDIVIISGSLPRDLSQKTYATLIRKFKLKTEKVLVDLSGVSLAYCLNESPYLIKPNLFEFEQIIGKKLNNRKTIQQEANKLLDKGITNILISMGAYGSLFFSKENKYKIDPIPVKVESPVGAGDSQVGAFAYGLEQGLTTVEILTLASAVSTAMVATPGTDVPSNEKIQEFIKQVRFNFVK